ncbi:MAG: alpha/beta hydrolase [Pseudoxanthomonas sp.]
MGVSSRQAEDWRIRVRRHLHSEPAEAPLVLFLHGFPQFADAWKPVLSAVGASAFHAVAVDQRGYSPGARPDGIDNYTTKELVADVLHFAEVLGHDRFHLVAHDWGGMIAWELAARFPERLMTLSVLSTPHTTSILHCIRTDEEQARKSEYILFFRLPDHAVEAAMLANNAERLRVAYRGQLSPEDVERNVRRLSEPGALTAALNWYRALDMDVHVGSVHVPTLFIWGEKDHALGEAAAIGTSRHVAGPYRFVRLSNRSHWLLEEAPDEISKLIVEHLKLHGTTEDEA